MVRKRSKAPRAADGVPDQLAAPSFEFWATPEAVEGLAVSQGLDPSLSVAWPGVEARWRPWSRFQSFRRAWAAQQGMTNSQDSEDLHQLRAVGVYSSSRPAPGFPKRRLRVGNE